MSKIESILITGSSGTIGTRLSEVLLEKGFTVHCVDWKANQWSKDIDAKTVRIDLRDKDACAQLPTDVDLVIHLAANARVYNLVVEPQDALDNITTTFNVLEHVRKHNIPRIMFASSRETYGNSEETVHAEGDVDINNCESPYTASKISGEVLVNAYNKCYDIDFITFRFSNVYGMYDNSDRVIPLFVRKTLAGEDLTVFGEDKLLDFTFIDDTIEGICACIAHFEMAKNSVYNLSYGEGTKIVDVAHMIIELLGASTSVHLADNRVGEVVKHIADISHIQKNAQFTPKVPIAEGVKRSIAWYKEHIK